MEDPGKSSLHMHLFLSMPVRGFDGVTVEPQTWRWVLTTCSPSIWLCGGGLDLHHVTTLIALSDWQWCQIPRFVCCVTGLSRACQPRRPPRAWTNSDTGMTLQLLQPLINLRAKQRLDGLRNHGDCSQITCLNQPTGELVQNESSPELRVFADVKNLPFQGVKCVFYSEYKQLDRVRHHLVPQQPDHMLFMMQAVWSLNKPLSQSLTFGFPISVCLRIRGCNTTGVISRIRYPIQSQKHCIKQLRNIDLRLHVLRASSAAVTVWLNVFCP